MRINDGLPARKRRKYSSTVAARLRSQVVENTQTKHDIEAAVSTARQVANIILDERAMSGLALNRLTLSNVFCAPFEAYDLGSLHGKLKREASFQAGEIEDAALVKGLSQ